MGEKKGYKATVIKYKGWRDPIRKFACTCGQSGQIDGDEWRNACPDCGNNNIVRVDSINVRENKNGEKYFLTYDGMYEVLEKGDKLFHIKKTMVTLKVFVDDECNLTKVEYKLRDVYELKYDLRFKEFEITKNGNPLTPTERNLDLVLRDRDKMDVINLISTDNNKDFYLFVKDWLGSQGREVVKKLSRGLLRLKKYPAPEILYFAGFTNLNTFRYGKILKHRELAPPHKLLGVPKYLLKYLREHQAYYRPYYSEKLNELHEKINGNNVKILLDIMCEESDFHSVIHTADDVITLYEEYGYKDIKRLALYLAREVKLQQGITNPKEAATLLKDYVRMCKEMEINYIKFPKSLKKDHDIAKMNYQAKEDELKNKKFKEVVNSEDYQKLTYKTKQYSIISPQEIYDLIKEGKSLSHCVASYVNDVINNKCKIYFLRETQALNTPLVTIEVRRDMVRQARGAFNKRPNSKESAFIEEWARTKNLQLGIY